MKKIPPVILKKEVWPPVAFGGKGDVAKGRYGLLMLRLSLKDSNRAQAGASGAPHKFCHPLRVELTQPDVSDHTYGENNVDCASKVSENECNVWVKYVCE